MTEGWPKLFLRQQLVGFLDAKMAGQKIVMVAVDQLHPDSLEYKR